MSFVSTRGEAPGVGFSQALLAGLAPDGGLYVPQHWPDLAGLQGDLLPALAHQLIGACAGDDPLQAALPGITTEAFSRLTTPTMSASRRV